MHEFESQPPAENARRLVCPHRTETDATEPRAFGVQIPGAEPAMRVWGGVLLGTGRRNALFGSLCHSVTIVSILILIDYTGR